MASQWWIVLEYSWLCVCEVALLNICSSDGGMGIASSQEDFV